MRVGTIAERASARSLSKRALPIHSFLVIKMLDVSSTATTSTTTDIIIISNDSFAVLDFWPLEFFLFDLNDMADLHVLTMLSLSHSPVVINFVKLPRDHHHHYHHYLISLLHLITTNFDHPFSTLLIWDRTLEQVCLGKEKVLANKALTLGKGNHTQSAGSSSVAIGLN